ncbi:UNVERIFIED_CONTAM: hypothetical protein HDU68_004391 [Siphonaria sp. JEL0065]|nr:hypothetical protein HDU68_004391 [Siphonaria sp. JEL0065]
MKVNSIVAAAALVASVMAADAVVSPLAPVPHNLLWPRPQKFTSGSDSHSINPEALTFNIVGGNKDSLTKAVSRFTSNTLAIGCNVKSVAYGCDAKAVGDIATVSITVSGTDPADLAQADESYVLDTTASGVSIKAVSTVGALHALETLAQLVKPNEKLPFHVKTDAEGCAVADAAGYARGFSIPSGPWHIEDKPSYSYRGVSLDTSRNYIPVSSIFRTLDGMASTKLNTYPDLSTAAYSKLSIYTYDDVKAVIQYAAERGIRVIPEFDSPAHANAYSFSKDLAPYVLCVNGGAGGTAGFWPTCPEPPCGNINIADPKAAQPSAKLIKEYTTLFTDSVFHLGGDEIENFCLAATKEYTDVVFPGQNITEIWDTKNGAYWAAKDQRSGSLVSLESTKSTLTFLPPPSRLPTVPQCTGKTLS